MAKSALMCSNVCKQCSLRVNNTPIPSKLTFELCVCKQQQTPAVIKECVSLSILNNVVGMDLKLHTHLGFDGLTCIQVLKYVIHM